MYLIVCAVCVCVSGCVSCCFSVMWCRMCVCLGSPSHPLPETGPLSSPGAGLSQGHKAAVPGGCLLFWLSLGANPVTPQQCSVSFESQCQIPGPGVAEGGRRLLSLSSPSSKLASGEQEVAIPRLRPWAVTHTSSC